jgi:hypothetical protein
VTTKSRARGSYRRGRQARERAAGRRRVYPPLIGLDDAEKRAIGRRQALKLAQVLFTVERQAIEHDRQTLPRRSRMPVAPPGRYRGPIPRSFHLRSIRVFPAVEATMPSRVDVLSSPLPLAPIPVVAQDGSRGLLLDLKRQRVVNVIQRQAIEAGLWLRQYHGRTWIETITNVWRLMLARTFLTDEDMAQVQNEFDRWIVVTFGEAGPCRTGLVEAADIAGWRRDMRRRGFEV